MKAMCRPGSLVLALGIVLSGCSKEKVAVWQPDEPAAAPTIQLAVVEQSRTRLRLQVIGSDLPDLYGVAYRLAFDPAVLRLVSHDPAGDFWPAAPDLLHHATVPAAAPGLLVAAITRRGEVAGADTGPARVLAEVELERLAPGRASPITFVTPRCAAFDSTGAPIADVSWVGGQLER